MTHQIQQFLQSHPDYETQTLIILDVGGGKGSLAIHLGRKLNWNMHTIPIPSDNKVPVTVTPAVTIWVVNINQGAIVNGHSTATKLNLPVEFWLADALFSKDLLVEEADLDVVVALHACIE